MRGKKTKFTANTRFDGNFQKNAQNEVRMAEVKADGICSTLI